MEIVGDILGDTLIWTPPIEEVGRSLARWIRTDQPGAAVYGPMRNGKTSAVMYLMNGMLPEFLGYKVPVIHAVIPGLSPTRGSLERDLLQTLMLAAGCRAIGSRDRAALRSRFYSHIQDVCDAAGSRRVVIVLDEAQKLSFKAYEELILHQNELKRLNLKVFFLLVGQPELETQYSTWVEEEAFQIVGRFFMRLHFFDGILAEDIPKVLEGFDDDPSGQSPLARLLPTAYASGWRLSNLGSGFQDAIQILTKRHSLQGELRLPMQYLRSAVIDVVDRMVSEPLDPAAITVAHVLYAVQETGFLGAMNYYMRQRRE